MQKPEDIIMSYKENRYKVFEMFRKQWALATAGSPDDFNTCTIGWGSLGSIWDNDRTIVTIYINEDRYTWEYLMKNEKFTVAFFPPEYRRDLQVLGTTSGRDKDKVAMTSLTPREIDGTVTFQEAELTFVCKKLYADQFHRELLAKEISEGIYKDWHPHYMFVGEIIDVIQK